MAVSESSKVESSSWLVVWDDKRIPSSLKFFWKLWLITSQKNCPKFRSLRKGWLFETTNLEFEFLCYLTCATTLSLAKLRSVCSFIVPREAVVSRVNAAARWRSCLYEHSFTDLCLLRPCSTLFIVECCAGASQSGVWYFLFCHVVHTAFEKCI